MGKLNNSELLWLWKIVPINLFLIWLIVYPRRIMAQLHWICTLQSVCGSKKQTLFLTHGREAFQFTFKEQAPSRQSVFLVVHLLGGKRHMGLLWGKTISSWWAQVHVRWNPVQQRERAEVLCTTSALFKLECGNRQGEEEETVCQLSVKVPN